MKSTGMVRRLDDLGRVVIPVEIRRTLGWEEKVPVEIYVDDGKIVLKKYEPGCVFCGEAEGVLAHRGKRVCRGCVAAMYESLRKAESVRKAG